MSKITQDKIRPLRIKFNSKTVEDTNKACNDIIDNINKYLITNLERNAKNLERASVPMNSLQELEAADRIEHEFPTVQVAGVGGAVTLTSTPTISAGYDGERLLIVGTDDTNTITIQDESSLPNSLIHNIGSTDVTIGLGDVVGYIYSKTTGFWEPMIPNADDLMLGFANTAIIGTGMEYETIQAALDANPTAGFLFLVCPGTYLQDTINFTADYQQVEGMGSMFSTVVASADATICNGSNFISCTVKNLLLALGLPTTAIPNIVINDGNVIFDYCLIATTVAASIATVEQPSVLRMTGTGEASFINHCIISCSNDGVEATAIKVAFIIDGDGSVHLWNSHVNVDSENATDVTALCYFGGFGDFNATDSYIDVDDQVANYVVGTGYVIASTPSQEFIRCEIAVYRSGAGVADVAAFYASGAGFATIDSYRNNITVDNTATPAQAYSYYQAGTPEIYSFQDNVEYASGYSGNVTFYSPAYTNVTTVNVANYDLLMTDRIVHVIYTTTGPVASLTLPSAQTLRGRKITIKDAGGAAAANNITIDTEGAETIDGAATAVINNDYNSLSLYSDGTNWFIY